MKLLKIFQAKKSQSSPVLGSANSSRTSSSSSNASSSPHSSDFSLAEMQSASPDHHQKGLSNSRRKRSVKNTGMSSTRHVHHDVQHDVPMVLSAVVDPEHQELVDAFKIFDSNGDGRISAAELGAVLRSLGDDPSDEDLQLMMDAVDADKDGHIDFQEFINLNRVAGDGAGVAARSEELRAAFHVFDIDKNDYISAEELHQVLRGLGEPSLTIEECSRMINSVDSDGDGLVDFEEFEKMMTNNCVF